ncbi:MAG TPA: glucoamylase family protein, partial [Saprospiraceae bacterium]|nr:glucoamylase family protein [Saprospiraceae bacterium]
SPDKGWSMNLPISGWNECLITYILAASSPAHGIPPEVYHRGWASNGGIVNNQQAYGINLPLGSGTGGPLFFEHYSFLGIDPRGLKDQYADYWEQVRAHTLINRAYCIANPRHYYGYGPECWGLTAGDVYNGYTASSPANDVSVIGPTAALSSMPYTPEESLDALHFFYYKLGDRLWGKMGFYDGFSLDRAWFAESTLAIDQGPIVIMIENYRTALIWNLLMKAPEIKAGMEKLGFESPHF